MEQRQMMNSLSPDVVPSLNLFPSFGVNVSPQTPSVGLSTDTTLVVCFNGPRRSDGAIQFHRVDAAIVIAQQGYPLLLVGDANKGEDLAAFVARAQAAGVSMILSAYHPGGKTLSDARAIIWALEHGLGDHETFGRIRDVLMVTDDWHRPRAHTMLVGELEVILGPDHPFVVHCHDVIDQGERPTPQMLLGEGRGREMYLQRKYGETIEAPAGKPSGHGSLEHHPHDLVLSRAASLPGP